MALCPICGEDNPLRAKFCLNCGASMAADVRESARQRRTVTILFADVVGSTAMGEHLDPESFLKVIGRYFSAMRQVIERHGGTVEKFIGDAVMAVFGIPQLSEDDALRAVRAAHEMRDHLTELNEELRRDWGVEIQTRTGVNTGEVLTGDPSVGDALVVGDAVNTAARLEQVAGVGEILLGEGTYQLVRDDVDAEAIEPLTLKGKGELVNAYRLRGMTAAAEWERPEGVFLSRRLELAFLESVYESVVAERACHQVTVLGSAGVGKTRLAQEFVVHARAKATVVFGRCLPYGEGITYWPVLEIIKAAAELRDGDTSESIRESVRRLLQGTDVADRVEEDLAHLLGLSDDPVSSEELQWAVRKLLEALAVDRPLVIVLEDLQWAEQTFLDLVDHIWRWSRDVPIMVMCLGRSEVLERRPQWGQERKRATALALDPLSSTASEQLVESLAPGLDEDLRQRIVTAAGGLPLFVRSMVSMLVDQHVLTLSDGVWKTAGEVSDVTVPPTIQAVLSARLDRLPAEERAVIERASLVGEEFSRADVEELSSASERLLLNGVLETLARKDLIRPHDDATDPPAVYRFSHILIRDIAYREMPKESRAELHERFGAWIERNLAGRSGTYDEILGYHLEQAYRLRAELRPDDRHATELAARAGNVLKIAGHRAFARHDPHAALNLLSRAMELAPDDPEGLLLIADVVRARVDLGALDEARTQVTAALEEARGRGDLRAQYRLQIRLDEIVANTAPGIPLRDALARANEAAIAFEKLDDRRGLSLAEYWASTLRFWLGEGAIAVRGLERALANSAGDPSLAATIVTFQAAAQIWGPTPAAEIERWSKAVLKEWSGVPLAEAAAMIGGAYAHALQGRASDARKLANRARSIYADMGLMVLLARATSVLSLVEFLVDDPVAAERGLRQAYELLDEMGETGFLSTVTSLLADVVCEQGRAVEAEALARRALELAQPDDVDPQTRGRAVLAVALARTGHPEEAEALAREAVERCASTDLVMIQADAARHAGDVHDAIGKPADAVVYYEQALTLYEVKGNEPMAARVRRALGTPEHRRSS